jgi:hypothetical protein
MTVAMILLAQAEPFRLPVPVSAPDRSVQGVVHLVDEESIAHLVTALGKDDVSLEAQRNKLFVKLLRAVEGSVDLIGGSGRLYRVLVVPGQRTAPELSIRSPRAPAAGQLPAPLRLLRAMRVGAALDGAVVTKSDAVIHDDGTIVVQIQRVYRIEELTGYVCTVRNRGGRPVDLDPTRFRAEGVLAVGVKDYRLGAGEVTRLYVVLRRSDDE